MVSVSECAPERTKAPVSVTVCPCTEVRFARVSIAGFDDSDLAKAVWPPLTTIRQPVRELAYAAADLMLSGTAPDPQVTLEHRLMVRSTTGPAGTRLA